MNGGSIESAAPARRIRMARAAALVAVFAFVVGACSDDDVDSGESTEQDDTIEALNDEVDEQTQRADDAEEALIEIAQQFPVTVTASLEEFDLKGAYTMSLTEAYCDGLSTCGAGRPDIRVDIVDGANGLELKIPNVLTAGLFAINGSLFAVTDSDLILEPCGATQRVSRVSTTIFADGVSIDADGARTLTGLGASLLVSADAVDDCTAGVVFWAATLVPA